MFCTDFMFAFFFKKIPYYFCCRTALLGFALDALPTVTYSLTAASTPDDKEWLQH